MEKKVKMEVKEGQNEKKKLSYEELENVCHQLSEQSRTLYKRLQDNNLANMFKRLDYLFAVLEQKESFIKAGKEDFVNECICEIVNMITIPKAEEENSEEIKEEK